MFCNTIRTKLYTNKMPITDNPPQNVLYVLQSLQKYSYSFVHFFFNEPLKCTSIV